MDKKETKLSNVTIILMMGTAIFYDAIQWLLAFIFLDWLVGFFAFPTFWLWFKIKGISFFTPKRAIAMGGGFVIEIFPFLASLPAWTAAVAIVIADVKIKEKASI